MANKKRDPRPFVRTDPKSVERGFIVTQAFEGYKIAATIVDPKEVERIKEAGHFSKLVGVEVAFSEQVQAFEKPRDVFLPSRQTQAALYDMPPKQRAEYLEKIGFTSARLTLPAALGPRLREFASLLDDYHITFNPIFIMDLIRLWPDSLPLPMSARAYLQRTFGQIVQSAHAVAARNPAALSAGDIVDNVAAYLEMKSPGAPRNAIDGFVQYREDLVLAADAAALVDAGRSANAARNEVANRRSKVDKASASTVRRAQEKVGFVIKTRFNDKQ